MEFHEEKFVLQDWRHWSNLIWILVPVFAINELVFGQRVPKILWIEKNSRKGYLLKTKVPCPHCGVVHDYSKFMPHSNGLGNYFGLFCDNCGHIIPCLRNLTSLLLIALTQPIWQVLYEKNKKIWLEKQKVRFERLKITEANLSPFRGKKWIAEGLAFGLFMYFFSEVLMTFLMEGELKFRSLLIGIPIFLISGLGYGLLMKWFWRYQVKDDELTHLNH
jgi:hypothetical protein